jgi:hypothetical protein
MIDYDKLDINKLVLKLNQTQRSLDEVVERGFKLIAKGLDHALNTGEYNEIPIQMDENIWTFRGYTQSYESEFGYQCTCMAFRYPKDYVAHCKHTEAIELFVYLVSDSDKVLKEDRREDETRTRMLKEYLEQLY